MMRKQKTFRQEKPSLRSACLTSEVCFPLQNPEFLPWIWSDPLDEELMSYVNLVEHPETNTGTVLFVPARFIR